MYKSELIALLAKSIHEQGDDEVSFIGNKQCGLDAHFNVKSVYDVNDGTSDETIIYGEEI